MGGAICSCCSRSASIVPTTGRYTETESDNETHPMLNAKQKAKVNTQPPSSGGGYGSVGSISDEHRKYEPLKSDTRNHEKLKPKHKSFPSQKAESMIEHNKTDEDKNEEVIDEAISNNSESETKNKETNDLFTEIPTSQQNISITNAGYQAICGEYRWWGQLKKWCYFQTDNQYGLESGIPVSNVYNQLNKLQSKNAHFKWNDDVSECWIIYDLTGNQIYYASPLVNHRNELIPSDGWISVHGSLPEPHIAPNTGRDTLPPNDEALGLKFIDIMQRKGNDNSKTNKSANALMSVSENQNMDTQEQDMIDGVDNKNDVDDGNGVTVEVEDDDDDQSDVSEMST